MILNEGPMNFEDAPHGSTISFKISRMLRTGARFCSKFSGCSARERDFFQNFQDALHGDVILNEGPMNFKDPPHGSTISFKISGCSA